MADNPLTTTTPGTATMAPMASSVSTSPTQGIVCEVASSSTTVTHSDDISPLQNQQSHPHETVATTVGNAAGNPASAQDGHPAQQQPQQQQQPRPQAPQRQRRFAISGPVRRFRPIEPVQPTIKPHQTTLKHPFSVHSGTMIPFPRRNLGLPAGLPISIPAIPTSELYHQKPARGSDPSSSTGPCWCVNGICRGLIIERSLAPPPRNSPPPPQGQREPSESATVPFENNPPCPTYHSYKRTASRARAASPEWLEMAVKVCSGPRYIPEIPESMGIVRDRSGGKSARVDIREGTIIGDGSIGWSPPVTRRPNPPGASLTTPIDDDNTLNEGSLYEIAREDMRETVKEPQQHPKNTTPTTTTTTADTTSEPPKKRQRTSKRNDPIPRNTTKPLVVADTPPTEADRAIERQLHNRRIARAKAAYIASLPTQELRDEHLMRDRRAGFKRYRESAHVKAQYWNATLSRGLVMYTGWDVEIEGLKQDYVVMGTGGKGMEGGIGISAGGDGTGVVVLGS